MLTVFPFARLHITGALAMFTAATVLGGACTETPVAQESQATDSLTIHITSVAEYSSADIFVFDDSPAGGRIFHSGPVASSFLQIPHPGRDIICTGIANAGGEFTEDAFPFYSVLENIAAEFRSEDPRKPMLSGICNVSPSDTRAELELTPLLCSICVECIQGGRDVALSDPVIWLENLNPWCNLLRYNGFYPPEMLEGAQLLDHPEMVMQSLPFNLGTGVREAAVRLWCYPNESRITPTQICLGGYSKNKFITYKSDLPPLGRAAELSLMLIVDKGTMTCEREESTSFKMQSVHGPYLQ